MSLGYARGDIVSHLVAARGPARSFAQFFGFESEPAQGAAPARVVEFCASMARAATEMPIYVGLAGPINPVALLRIARYCAAYADCDVVGIHLFTFGGVPV